MAEIFDPASIAFFIPAVIGAVDLVKRLPLGDNVSGIATFLTAAVMGGLLAFLSTTGVFDTIWFQGILAGLASAGIITTARSFSKNA